MRWKFGLLEIVCSDLSIGSDDSQYDVR